MKEALKYTIDESYFKENGYIFQGLFASDIPYFYKLIAERTVWCCAQDKEIFIEDWYGFLTPTILNYFNENKDGENLKYAKTFDFYYLAFKINRKTGEIVNKVPEMVIDEDHKCNGKDWQEICLPIEDTLIIYNEIIKITNSCNEN